MLQDCSKNSFYIIAKNLDRILKDSEKAKTTENKTLSKDLRSLSKILQALGFQPVSNEKFGDEFKHDLIFESKDALCMPFKLLDESHKFKGHFPYAAQYLGNLKDRLHFESLQQTKQQDALVEWNDLYSASLNNQKGIQKGSIAAPIYSPWISKIKLKIKQFFSGTAQNTLKFGLDLSEANTSSFKLRTYKVKKLQIQKA